MSSPHRTNTSLTLKELTGEVGISPSSRWVQGSISTRMQQAGYSWRLCHPRAPKMESLKIDEHGSKFTGTYYDAKLSKPKIKAIKPKYMYAKYEK